MQEFGMFDAKTHFSEIVKRVVETGQPVRITNRGQPVVDITPANQSPAPQPTPTPRRTNAEIFAELRTLTRSWPKATLEEIQADIAEGRK
jgi:prevent-host-death family protein